MKLSQVDICCPSIYESGLVTLYMHWVNPKSKDAVHRLAGYLALTLGVLLTLVSLLKVSREIDDTIEVSFLGKLRISFSSGKL
jgi:hypothetical protein